MKTLLFTIISSLIVLSSISYVEARPYRTDQELIDASDVVLTGTIISKDTKSLLDYISYEIKVEKYLKGIQQNDVLSARGLNVTGGLLGNTIFEVGDRGLFYLNNYAQKYDNNELFGISPYSKKIESIPIDRESCCDFTIPTIAIITSSAISIVVYLKIGKK